MSAELFGDYVQTNFSSFDFFLAFSLKYAYLMHPQLNQQQKLIWLQTIKTENKSELCGYIMVLNVCQ